MTYFPENRGNERQDYERKFAESPQQENGNGGWDPAYDDYDDGFDELYDLPEDEDYDEPDDAETAEEKKQAYRFAASIGDIVATVAGALVILLLAAFLINMIQFVSTDAALNLSLWQTKIN